MKATKPGKMADLKQLKAEPKTYLTLSYMTPASSVNSPCVIVILEVGAICIVHENPLVLVEFWVEFIGGIRV